MGSPARTGSASRRLGGLLALLAATLVLAATLLAGALVPGQLRDRAERERAALEETVRPARSLAGDIAATIDHQAASVRGYLLDRDIGHKERYRRARSREDSLLMQLAPLTRRLGAQTVAQLGDLRVRAADWHADQERLLFGEPGFAPDFLRRLPAQQGLYDGVRLAARRLEATLAGIEEARQRRLAEVVALEPPVFRGLAWLTGVALLVTLLLAGRLLVISGRPPARRLEEAERRFGDVAASLREVFWIRDAASGRFLYVSPAYESVWGRSRDPLRAGYGPFLATVHPEDRERIEAVEPPADVEYRIVRPDGTVRWIAERCLPIADAADGSARWLGVASDITERIEARRHLAHLALHDPVTGLGNHLLLLDRLEHAVARARRSGHAIGVLVVEIDDLGPLTERLGWSAADQLLAAVGRRLRQSLRSEDTLVRLGDDAFVAVLEQVDGRSQVLRAASRIADAFETPFPADGTQVGLAARVAAAVSEAGAVSSAEISRLADEALRRSRLAGAAPYESIVGPAGEGPSIFEPAGSANRHGRLRQALEAREFRVFYQPILDLRTEGVVGLEALLRWQHPERGLLLPGEFLGLAGKSGLIHALGFWVLRRVCRDLRAWEAIPPLRDAWASVNLSPRQFELPDFVDQVARILDEAAVLPVRLRVEVGETTWFRARGPLERLRELGVAVAIDGFGDRYGALGALRRLPVDAVKLSRRLGFDPFVREVSSSPVAPLAALATGLGIEVSAVGIESVAEQKALLAAGCGAGQGFHLQPPMSDEALVGWAAPPLGRIRGVSS